MSEGKPPPPQDDDDPIVILGLGSSASRPAVVDSQAVWEGDDLTVAPVSAQPAPAAGWDGDDRTVAPVSAPPPPAGWDGDDRTVAPVSAPAPAAGWDGDDRTVVPASAPAAAPAGVWDGDDRTVPPVAVSASATTAPPPAPSMPAAAAPVSMDDWLTGGRRGPLSDQTLGDFVVGGVLGEGGMGLVYRARQVSLNRRAALKVLASNLAGDDGLVRRFYAEAHTAGRIASEHVVQVYFAGEVDGSVFYAMEFVEGSDLAHLAAAARDAGKRLPCDESARYVMQAAEGLAAAALRNVVHRDIKPQNLLVTPRGLVKIADFGIAKALDEQSLTLAGQTVGTPAYCSPEQGRGQTVDHRSDLYSLGVVLYELLTGQKPFTANTPNALIYQHNYAEPKPPRSLDPAIPEVYEAVCMRLLMKDPAQRYQQAGDLAGDLRRILEGRAPAVPAWSPALGTGAMAALARDQGWRRRLLVPALIMMLLIGGGTVWGVAHYAARRGEQADIQRRKQNLAVLDQVAPPPASAVEDIAWLVPRLGAQEADVVRWQAKLDRVAAFERRLSQLDGAGLLPADARAAAERDLTAYEAEVGADAGRRWRAVIGQSLAEIARLRGELAVLDGKAPVDRATADRLVQASAALDRLAGAGDAEATRWREALATRERRLGELRTALAVLDRADAVVDEPTGQRLTPLLAEWTALTAPDDVDALRWAAPLAASRARLAALRARLARLDQVDQPGVPLLQELSADLAELCRLTAPDEPRRSAWVAKAAASTRQVEGLRQELSALLDPLAPVGAPAQAQAERLLGAYRALVSADDGRLVAWERRLGQERAETAALRDAVACLSRPGRLGAAERDPARRAVAGLELRAAASVSELAAWKQRLDAEDQAIAALRAELRAHVAAGTLIGTQAAATAAELGEAVGQDDAEARELLARRDELLRLQERLAVLDRLASEPGDAAAGIARWQALMPAGDAAAARWSAKLQRIAAARAALAPLDRGSRAPEDASQQLALLRDGLVGPDDPAVQRWSARIGRIDQLRAQLGTALAAPVLADAAAARADLDELASLVGEGADIAVMRARLLMLGGPPRPAWAVDAGHDASGPWADALVAGVRLRLRHIPAGTVALGSPADEPGRDADEPLTPTRLTRSFWLSDSEVTQALWQAVMGGNPSAFRGPDRPVESLTWDQAEDFCARLSGLAAGFAARLPSEAEWELACRAGSSGSYQGPEGPAGSPAELGWYGRSDGTHEVRRLRPNRHGLYDMHGNVGEWCRDREDAYASPAPDDRVGTRGEKRIVRGGSWADPPRALRAANRVGLDPGSRSRLVGLRIAVTAAWP